MDKNEVIKKHILKYIFSCEKCEFINDPKVTLYNRVSKEIEKELGIILLNTSEFYNIFNMLVDNKTIEITYDESEQLMKNGVLKLYDSIEVRNYLLKNNYIGLKEAFEYVDKRYLDSQKMFSEQLARMENAENELKMQRDELLNKIHEQEGQIKNFYNNILTILGILIAVFSIIGFNIGGIKFILGSDEKLRPWVYAGSIGIINLCIVISMYLLFWLVNKVINKEEERRGAFSNKIIICMFFLLIIIIVMCFAIA